jgi:hypothetical protein
MRRYLACQTPPQTSAPSFTASVLRHTRSRSSNSAIRPLEIAARPPKNIAEGDGRETPRLASFADTQCTSLRFVGLRGLRPVPGLRPLRHCLFGQTLALAYGCSDDRSGSEKPASRARRRRLFRVSPRVYGCGAPPPSRGPRAAPLSAALRRHRPPSFLPRRAERPRRTR